MTIGRQDSKYASQLKFVVPLLFPKKVSGHDRRQRI